MIYLILTLGIAAASSSIIMIKFSTMSPLWLSSLRLFIAVLALSPLFINEVKKHKKEEVFGWIKKAIIPGILLSLHFMTWIFSARLIPAANSTLIVNLSPLAMPAIIFILARQRITRLEFIATIWALIGVYILIGQDFSLSKDYLQGDAVSLISMLLFTLYLALANKWGKGIPLWGYLVPLYFTAAIIAMLGAIIQRAPLDLMNDYNWLNALLLGLIPTVMGHSIFNYSMTKIRPQIVTLANLSQVVFASVYGFLFFDEIPTWNLYVAAAFILSAAYIALRPKKKHG
ncbi:DMT family transporter [Spirochaeta cellobiosiphila]|uniref:DMT family transporter n=1 Tax=Spirochaeta cellobiosiphila TaxID=504483 RepID=UPI001B7FCC98|nr:DMT family transporter [Spirochaeta cellobiosiphila]